MGSKPHALYFTKVFKMELPNLREVLKYMESWEELQGSKGLRSSVLILALPLLLCDLQE